MSRGLRRRARRRRRGRGRGLPREEAGLVRRLLSHGVIMHVRRHDTRRSMRRVDGVVVGVVYSACSIYPRRPEVYEF